MVSYVDGTELKIRMQNHTILCLDDERENWQLWKLVVTQQTQVFNLFEPWQNLGDDFLVSVHDHL